MPSFTFSYNNFPSMSIGNRSFRSESDDKFLNEDKKKKQFN